MTDPHDGGFRIHASGAIARELRRLQRLAVVRGQGQPFASALEQIVQGLRSDPSSVGDPLYQLAHLRLQVRSVIHAPLVIHFAVSQDSPNVYIKSAALLAPPRHGA